MKWLYFLFTLVFLVYIPSNIIYAGPIDYVNKIAEGNKTNIEKNRKNIEENKGDIEDNEKNISIKMNRNEYFISGQKKSLEIQKKINSLYANDKRKAVEVKKITRDLSNLDTKQEKQGQRLSTHLKNIKSLQASEKTMSTEQLRQGASLKTQENTLSTHSENIKSLQASEKTMSTEQLRQGASLQTQENTLSKHAETLNIIKGSSKEISTLISEGDKKAASVSEEIKSYIDRFWVLIAAVLVFFMQAGFKTYESGMVRKEHNDNVAIKNVLDWLIVCLVYFLVGFGLMFGDSWSGLIGQNLFLPSVECMGGVIDNSLDTAKIECIGVEGEGKETKLDGQNLGLEFFLYQLAFAATAATIVSGAMSERTALIPYIALSIFIAVFIYPLFGHWAWGGLYLLDNKGWLEAIGFRDFAGSTVVHSIGAWVALAGIIAIGARYGRYDADGNINTKKFKPASLGTSALGVFILWFGWWGFNGGSGLQYNDTIAPIILKTTLAGAAAGMTAFFHALSQSRDKYDVFPKLLGGILGGLVAITACCNVVSVEEAILIGAIAGLIHNYSYDFLMLKLKLDDPVGAIAVHGFCGVWGTLSVALFGDLSIKVAGKYYFKQDGFFLGETLQRIDQVFIQLVGITVAFLFAFISAYLFFKLIRRIPFIGLRVTVKDEKRGEILGNRF